MAVSNSFNYGASVSVSIVIAAALRKLSVLAEGQSATTTQSNNALEALNFMLMAWRSKGMPLWYLKTAYIYPDENTNLILLGPSGDNASEELILTKLTADAASGATTITVSITTDNDVIGTTANSDKEAFQLLTEFGIPFKKQEKK